jgi:hypothetical protein
MISDTKTLQEWASLDNIVILAPDGFDRTDPQLFERKFTKEEYQKGLILCTILSKAVKTPERKNCYRCKKRQIKKCEKYPRSVGKWIDCVCEDYELGEVGKLSIPKPIGG